MALHGLHIFEFTTFKLTTSPIKTPITNICKTSFLGKSAGYVIVSCIFMVYSEDMPTY